MSDCDHVGTGRESQIIGDSKYVKCSKCKDVVSVENVSGHTKSGKRKR